MIESFDKLGLNQNLIEGLKQEGINKPTDIQIKAIPLSLENKDIIGQSPTGSGKTLAYLLPIFQKIDTSKREMQAIILAPTHELAMQINREIKLLSENSKVPVTSTPIIGNANIKRQIEKLKEKPHIIVGSSGRILELIKKKKISAHTIKTNMKDRQLMIFSATINEKTLSIAKSLMKDAEFIKAKSENAVNPNITHMYFISEQRDKIEILRKLVASINPEKAIVFINKSDETEIITSKLKYHKIKAEGIHGSSSKEDRQKALEGFRSGKLQLLVASDIAARGLDIKNVSHIFNLDLPSDTKEYLHRVGRTSRTGEAGTAISIITDKDLSLIKKYEKDFKIEINLKTIYKGKILDSKKSSI